MADDDAFSRGLKKVPVAAIEAALAEVLSKLVDRDYVVSVAHIDFEPNRSALLTDAMELRLQVSVKIDPFGETNG